MADKLEKMKCKPRYNKKRLQTSLSVFNNESGEYVSFYANLYREGLKFPSFCCLGLTKVWCLVKNDFSTSEYKLLFTMLATMENENKVIFKMKEFSDEIGISPVSLRKSLEKLKKNNIIFEINKIGTYIKVYKVSPHILWRGDGIGHKEALKEWPSPITSSPIPVKFGLF